MSYAVLCCGDRNWSDEHLIRKVLEPLLPKKNGDGFVYVIHGGCRGADTLAGKVAIELGFNVLIVKADWDRHGKAAGPIRNKEMLVRGKPDVVYAFHDDLKSSKGTADMLRQARKAGIPCKVFSHF